MNDLYYELQDSAKRMNIPTDPILSNRQSLADYMPEFTKLSNSLHIKIQIIKNNNEEIHKMTEVIHTAASTLKEKECIKRIEQLQQSTNSASQEIKKYILEIDKVIAAGDPDEPESRAMVYKRRAIQQEVSELLQQSQNSVYNYNQVLQNKMKRQLQILQPSLNETQQDEIIQDPSGLERLVVEQTLGKASLQIQYRVQDIQDKYKDIQKLEKSAQYCFQMLQEIAFLVNEQGEQLVSIEANLNKAQNYIKRAEKHLAEEKKVHQKSRKKLCCMLLLGVVALGVIATPIILKFVNNS